MASPIGIFDSGIGGLTIARAIINALPHENVVYFGDTAHLPYGDKSDRAIKHYSKGITNFLLAKNCKLIVVACNTASSLAHQYLRKKFKGNVDFIDVISPITSHVALDNTSNNVGIIGTKGTIRSGMYEAQLKTLRPNITVHSLATPLLAPMIESGFFNNNISRAVIDSYLSHAPFKNMDTLILACTHYPLIKKDITAYYENKIQVMDATDFLPIVVKQYLERKKLLRKKGTARHHFYVSDYTESFEKTTKIFFGENIKLELADIWKKG